MSEHSVPRAGAQKVTATGTSAASGNAYPADGGEGRPLLNVRGAHWVGGDRAAEMVLLPAQRMPAARRCQCVGQPPIQADKLCAPMLHAHAHLEEAVALPRPPRGRAGAGRILASGIDSGAMPV